MKLRRHTGKPRARTTHSRAIARHHRGAYGLNKADASDAARVAPNGYTNIENYTFLLEAGRN